MIRHLAAAALLSTTLIGAAHADARDNDVIGAFQQLCSGSKPDLATIDQKAHAMKLTAGDGSGTQCLASRRQHDKAIFMRATCPDGPIELVGTDTSDSRGHMVTCGVSAGRCDGRGLSAGAGRLF